MAKVVAVHEWTKEGSASLPTCREWVARTLFRADGSHETYRYERVGQEVGDGYVPSWLSPEAPLIGHGGRSAGGRSYGIDLARLLEGGRQNYLDSSPAALAAWEQVQALLTRSAT